MFRTIAEGQIEGWDPVKLVLATQPFISDRSKAVLLLLFLTVVHCTCQCFSSPVLTLKPPITTAADDSLEYFFHYFHMKHQFCFFFDR